MSFLSSLLGVRQADRRKRYIIEQICQIAPRFTEGGSGVNFDEENCDWLMIPKYPLPERWRQRWTSLLIIFPTSYPDTPPTGFYLNQDLGLKAGNWDRHLFDRGFHGAPTIPGWHWYCVLAQVTRGGGWKPAANPMEPDNLFSFLNLIREALTSDE